MKKKTIIDNRYKHSKHTHGHHIRYYEEYNYFSGYCSTPYGLVSVYSQGDVNNSHCTRLEYVLNGYEYIRTINRRSTRLGLMRMAGKFAKEIYNENKGKYSCLF